jgi:hypothetical protein
LRKSESKLFPHLNFFWRQKNEVSSPLWIRQHLETSKFPWDKQLHQDFPEKKFLEKTRNRGNEKRGRQAKKRK